MKSRRMRGAGHVARMGKEKKVYRILVGDQGVDGRMGSKWILGRLAGGVLSGSIWFRIGTCGGIF
jgi:hypothetical protein